MFLIDDHLGGRYVSYNDKGLYCECCGDSDWVVDEVESTSKTQLKKKLASWGILEPWKVLKKGYGRIY